MNIYDAASTEQIQQLKGLIQDIAGNRPTVGTVSVVNDGSIDIALGLNSTVLKAVPVAGGTNGIVQGDKAYLLYFGNQAVALNVRSFVGGASSQGTSPHSHGDLYYTKAVVDGKLSGKSDLSHTHNPKEIHADVGYIGGWTIDSFGISEAHSRLDGHGFIAFGPTTPTQFGGLLSSTPPSDTPVGVWLGYDYGINTIGAATTINFGLDAERGTTIAGPKLSMFKDANNYLQWTGAKLLVKAANFKLDGSGNITASNVTLTGTITATAGAIGGWTITSSTIHSTNITLDNGNDKITVGAGIILDGSTQTIFVGSGTPRLQIDGANKLIRSSNFVAGLTGFQIDGAGNAEFDNIVARGSIKTAVFEKSLITAFAGSNIVAKSASVLAADCTATGTTFSISINAQAGAVPFASGDRIRFTDGTSSTWATVGASSGSGPYAYTATYQSGSNSATYRAGQSVVDYVGSGGGGWVYTTADDANGPFLSIQSSAGSPWSDATERVRVGNLRNAFGVGANNRYGFGAGDFSGGNYLMYNPTDGFVIKGGGGDVIFGPSGIQIGGTGNRVSFYDTNTLSHLVGTISYFASSPVASVLLNAKGITSTIKEGTIYLVANNFDDSTDATIELHSTSSGASAPAYVAIYDSHNYGVVSSGVFSGVTIGTHDTPNTMLDVRGSGTFTDGLNVGSASGAAEGQIAVTRDGTGTAGANTAMIVNTTSTGTPTTNFGSRFIFEADSSNHTTRSQSELRSFWETATDGSQRGAISLRVYDAAGQYEGFRVAARSSQAAISFFAGTSTVKQTVTGSRGGNAALASLLTALDAYGLITNSST